MCVDHADDASVAALFRRVADENGGLQLLVNNAALIRKQQTDPSPFWDKPLGLGDVLTVGLRSAYVASWYAASLLLKANRGSCVHIVAGATIHAWSRLWGPRKAGVDKMAADMAVDSTVPVSTVSIWMGIL